MKLDREVEVNTAANWHTINPILPLGVIGLETDTGKFKGGDGSTNWDTLIYSPGKGVIHLREVITDTTKQMENDHGYISNNVSRVVLTLPATATVGTVLEVTGMGTGGWKIAQNANQSIKYGASSSTSGVGGYAQSGSQWSSATLVCIVADLTWAIISAVGTITVA